MSRAVIAEEKILDSLSKYSQFPNVSVGVIIGQTTTQKDYILHIAPTPSLSKASAVSSIKDVDECILSDHARFVTRILPGGLWVIGIFIISEEDISSSNITRLRTLLQEIEKGVSGDFFLDGVCPSNDRLILHFNSKTNLYSCKSLDRSFSGTLKPVDLKFQTVSQSWYKVSSKFQIAEDYIDVKNTITLKEQFKELSSRLRTEIEKTQVLLNGKFRDKDSTIDTAMRGQGQTKSISAIFTSPLEPASNSEDIKHFKSSTLIRIAGVIPSTVFLHSRASIDEAVRAIKQDLIRSVGARFELHWDTLVDEEGGCPEEKELVHEPPRRVMVQPNGWNISLFDYLFPGEGANDVVNFYGDMLDLEVTEKNVTQLEQQPDSSSFIKGADLSDKEEQKNQKFIASILYVALALSAIVIALLFQLFLK